MSDPTLADDIRAVRRTAHYSTFANEAVVLAACPKCGYGEIVSHYEAEKTCRPNCVEHAHSERISRCCLRCRFLWFEAVLNRVSVSRDTSEEK